jgi:GTPase SAR1 family protein
MEITVHHEKYWMNLLDIPTTQEEYSYIRDSYLCISQGFLICFPINDQRSFEETIFIREQIQRSKDEEYPIILLCGTKGDLTAERAVERSAAEELAKSWRSEYMETSALDNTNVDRAFQYISECILYNSMDICTRLEQCETVEHNTLIKTKKKCEIM